MNGTAVPRTRRDRLDRCVTCGRAVASLPLDADGRQVFPDLHAPPYTL